MHSHLSRRFLETIHTTSEALLMLGPSHIQQFHLHPKKSFNERGMRARCNTHHPQIFKGMLVFKRDDIISQGYELQIVRRDRDISKYSFFFEDLCDEPRQSGNKEQGICVFA